jgi:hypothetical protein
MMIMNKFCHPFTEFELLGWRMEQFGTEICTIFFKAKFFSSEYDRDA